MKVLSLFIPATLVLAGCVADMPLVTGPSKGPRIEIVEATRARDTTRVVMRYKGGGLIPVTDETRAVGRALAMACNPGEDAIADTRTRENGLLTVKVFCVGVLQSDQVIDGTRLRG